jgi:lipopolysaccharide export system permease protein
MQFLWKYLDDMVGKGLENSVIIELMTYASLSLVTMALPLAVLLASIMTFGNLGERMELLAMKASGVSLLKIMRPLIVMNILVTIGAFLLADQVIPATNVKFAALLYSVKTQRPEMIIKEGIFSNDIDGFSIKVNKRDEKTNALRDIMVYDHRERKGNVNVTLADSGYLNISDDKNFMILTLYNGESYADEKPGDRSSKSNYPFQRQKFKKQDVVINVSNFNLKRADEKYFKDQYKMLKNDQILSAVDSFQVRYNEQIETVTQSLRYNQKLDQEIRTTFAPDSLRPTFVDTSKIVAYPISFDSILNRLELADRRVLLGSALSKSQANQRVLLQNVSEMYSRMEWINRYQIEWYRKYTWAIACLLFFFIGAPLGAIIRKGGFGLPVVVSILLFISYYLVTVISDKIAREGVLLVDMVMWFSTIVFFIIGFVLTHQAVTDSFLLNKELYNQLIDKMNIFKHLSKKKGDEASLPIE